MIEKNNFEKAIFELVTFMTVSARNLLEEPARYGPFRLIEATSRLISILEKEGTVSDRLASLREQMEAGKQTVMDSEEAFEAFLEKMVSVLVDEIEKETK